MYCPNTGRQPAVHGFTLIEMMIVIAIMAVMATMAIPTYHDRVIRAQVGEGLVMAEFAREAVSTHYRTKKAMPRDNVSAGLPPSDKVVGNYVQEMTVADGSINIRYGNRANKHLVGKTLSLRPAIVDGFPAVPVAWVCGKASVPEKMKVLGDNRTDLANEQLPIDCR